MTLPGILKRRPVHFGPGDERVGGWVREENVLVAYDSRADQSKQTISVDETWGCCVRRLSSCELRAS